MSTAPGSDGTRAAGGRWWLVPLLIALAAVVIRVVVIAADTGYEPINDAFDYDRHAVSIAAGEGYPGSEYGSGIGPTALRSPGYPAALAAVYAVSGDSVDAGRVAGALLGGVTVLLVFLLTAPVWGRRAGLLAAALTAVFPPLVLVSAELFNENLFIPLMLGSLLAATRYRDSGLLRWALLTGALGGAALLTRNAGLALLVPLLLALWLGGRQRGRPLAAPATMLAVIVMLVAPWTVRNAVEFGRFIPIAASSGVTLSGVYNETSRSDEEFPAGWRNPAIVSEFDPIFSTPAIDEATLDAELRESALEFAGAHPGYVVEATFHNLKRMFLLEAGSVVGFDGDVTADGIGSKSTESERIAMAIVAPLALLGIAVLLVPGLRREWPAGSPRPPPLLLWLVPLAFIAVSAPINGLPRHRLPIDPFMLIYASLGAAWLWGALRELRSQRRGRRMLGAGAALVAVLALGGCGGGDGGADSVEGADPATDPAGSPAPTESQPAARFARRADAICDETILSAQRLRERIASRPAPEATSGAAIVAKTVVRPGLAILERQASDLRSLAPPENAAAAYRVFVGLADVINGLLRERLAIGLAGGVAEAQDLERLIVEVGAEQRAAAAELGLSSCATDLSEIILPRPDG